MLPGCGPDAAPAAVEPDRALPLAGRATCCSGACCPAPPALLSPPLRLSSDAALLPPLPLSTEGREAMLRSMLACMLDSPAAGSLLEVVPPALARGGGLPCSLAILAERLSWAVWLGGAAAAGSAAACDEDRCRLPSLDCCCLLLVLLVCLLRLGACVACVGASCCVACVAGSLLTAAMMASVSSVASGGHWEAGSRRPAVAGGTPASASARL